MKKITLITTFAVIVATTASANMSFMSDMIRDMTDAAKDVKSEVIDSAKEIKNDMNDINIKKEDNVTETKDANKSEKK
jgi:hypothetical protein